ncbi:MAG: putative glycoside hydrolase [Roseburia sp.]|nr:putative glycoside hydrolase [Roseburia sp.]
MKKWKNLTAAVTVFAAVCAVIPGCAAKESAGVKSGDVMPATESETVAGREEEAETEQYANHLPGDWKDTHTRVRGIYVTGPMAGSGAMEDLIALVDKTELNAMVIDVKNDDGNITFDMQLDRVSEMGAGIRYIPDIEALLGTLKEHGIYTIARVVCFKDPYLAEHYPELALKKPDGTPVTDANGNAFVNPYREEAWEYIVDVSEKAAELGFDEIQFDYVRFPIGEDADAADYGVDMAAYTKEQAITEFLTYATARLHEKGIVLGADVFGTIIGSETDIERVGQNYRAIGEKIDVLSPMVYPSHYENGVFGLDVPDAHPYETVLGALEGSARELDTAEKEGQAVVRPWLQSFTATWVDGHITYEGEEVRAQIQAVYDAGYEEWILWNASNRYSEDGLLPAEEGEAEKTGGQ